MRIARAGCPIWLLFLLSVSTVRGQEGQRVPEAVPLSLQESEGRNVVSVLFDRNLNTYNWLGQIGLDTTVLGTSLLYRQQYLSNIFLVDPSAPGTLRRTLESNQHTIGLALTRPILEGVAVRTEWNTLVFSDNKGVGLSDANFTSLLGGFEFAPSSLFSIAPLGGYRWDTQGGVADRGPSAQLFLRFPGSILSGYRIEGIGQYHTDWLNPRRLESHFLRTKISTSFTEEADDSLEAGVFRTRREYYTSGDTVLESRLDDQFTISNVISYQFTPRFNAGLLVALASRNLEKSLRTSSPGGFATPQFDTEVSEFVLQVQGQLGYLAPDGRSSALLRFSHFERDENHRAILPSDATSNQVILWNERNRQEQSKDNLSKRSVLTGSVGLPLWSADRISISGTGSILRYDTPSQLNVEDRDELLVALSVLTTHRLSRFLDLDLLLDGTYSHLVYLLEERSANNNVNRVLRLAPRVTYRPADGISSANTFEVLANYTVYDFEEGASLARSFSYRQFAWLDSTSIDLTHRVGLDFFAYFKLYERGRLNWDDFQERTENSFVDRTLAAQFRFSPTPGTLLAAGIRSFSQSRYDYVNGGKSRAATLHSIGPTCIIQWAIGPASRLLLRGWYERRAQPDGSARSFPTIVMNVSVHL
jgi:hypothetical protein